MKKDFLLYVGFRFAVLLFGYLPFWVLYRISDCAVLLLYHVFRLRRKTVLENLQRAFPDASKQRINRLAKDCYRNFCDVMIIENLKTFTMSAAEKVKRFKLVNPALGQQYLAQKRSLIVVVGHFANWEWGTSKHHQVNYHCIDFYKPLKNRYIDRYVRWHRERHGSSLASVSKAATTFLKTRDKACCYTLLADKQNVKKRRFKSVLWLPFLGQDSPFLIGPEKYAKAFNHALVYAYTRRIRRGYYAIEIIPISEAPETTQPGEITKKWVALLEAQVRADPGSWLWFFAATRARQDHHQFVSESQSVTG